MANLKDLAERLKETIYNRVQPRPRELISPLPKTQPTPVPQGISVEEKMRKGFRAYADQFAGGASLPIEQHIPQFVQAAEKYPIFKQNPYLLPQISILESSAGRNVTRENNPLNWGARVQKQGLYSPKSWEESINDAITAIAGDVQARPPSEPGRFRQTTYYEPFRQSGSLEDFANTYEPANKLYYKMLTEGIKNFEKQ